MQPTDYQIIEARLHHCGKIARHLRSEHTQALIALGVDVHRELVGAYMQSGLRRSWLIDGQLAAVGGMIGSLGGSDGYVWLALADDVKRHPVGVVRELQRQLRAMMVSRRQLRIVLIEGDDKAIRLARLLGFKNESRKKYGNGAVLQMSYGTSAKDL